MDRIDDPERYDDSYVSDLIGGDPLIGWIRKFAARRPNGTWSFSDPTWYVSRDGRDYLKVVMQAAFIWCNDPENADETAIVEDDRAVWFAEYPDLPATDDAAREVAAAFNAEELNAKWIEPQARSLMPKSFWGSLSRLLRDTPTREVR